MYRCLDPKVSRSLSLFISSTFLTWADLSLVSVISIREAIQADSISLRWLCWLPVWYRVFKPAFSRIRFEPENGRNVLTMTYAVAPTVFFHLFVKKNRTAAVLAFPRSSENVRSRALCLWNYTNAPSSVFILVAEFERVSPNYYRAMFRSAEEFFPFWFHSRAKFIWKKKKKPVRPR